MQSVSELQKLSSSASNTNFMYTGEIQLIPPPPLRDGIKLNSYLFNSEILNSFLEKLIPTYLILKSLIPTNS